ncbi:MAG: hypothetical protein ACQEP9_06780 [Bacillota bacterium]
MVKIKLVLIITLVLLMSVISTVQATEEPVIIYSLDFIELSSELEQSLSMEFNQPKETGNEWEIIKNQDWMKDVDVSGEAGQFSAQGADKEEKSRLNYSSWVTTITNKQAKLELTERLIDFENKEEQGQQSQFRFLIEPKKIISNQKIRTEIKFNYQRERGNRAQIKMNSQVGATKEEPVAVLRKKITDNEQFSYKYFALYLKGTIVDADSLDQKDSVVAMGNMNGINQLFGENKDSNEQVESQLGLHFSKNREKVSYKRLNNRWEVELEAIHGAQEKFYYGDFSYSLLGDEKLFIVGRINDEITEQSRAVSAFGIRDRVEYSSLPDLEVSYFPFLYELEGTGKLDKDSIIEAKLEFETGKWSISCLRQKIDDDYFTGGTVNYSLNPNWGLRTDWSEGYRTEEEVYFGIVFKFNE